MIKPRKGRWTSHTIRTRRREGFYWAAVLATFALGTAVGDLSAFTLGLGYLASAVVYAVLIAVPAVGWWRFNLHPVVTFWSAYVLTRPLGASVADWLGKPTGRSGLGLGDGTVTLIAALLLAALVTWTAKTRPDPSTARPANPATSSPNRPRAQTCNTATGSSNGVEQLADPGQRDAGVGQGADPDQSHDRGGVVRAVAGGVALRLRQ
jgi:hypothetical protein